MTQQGVEQQSDTDTTSDPDRPVVLIVEDERDVADLYGAILAAVYTVRTAYTGDQVLTLFDHDVNVVLLDRRLKEWAGDELVSVIQDRKIDCKIVMVTAVNPDFDIVNLAIDEYLTKPVRGEELLRTVEEMLLWTESEINQQELLALISRRIALENEKGKATLSENTEYVKLNRRIEIAEDRLNVIPEGDVTTSHQPSVCPKCNSSWDISVGQTIGVLSLASFVWKCTQCGHVEQRSHSRDRRLIRR